MDYGLERPSCSLPCPKTTGQSVCVALTEAVKFFRQKAITTAPPQKRKTYEDLRKVRKDPRIQRRSGRDGRLRRGRNWSRRRRRRHIRDGWNGMGWQSSNLFLQSRNFLSQVIQIHRKLFRKPFAENRSNFFFFSEQKPLRRVSAFPLQLTAVLRLHL
jgi:hypothetical protein